MPFNVEENIVLEKEGDIHRFSKEEKGNEKLKIILILDKDRQFEGAVIVNVVGINNAGIVV